MSVVIKMNSSLNAPVIPTKNATELFDEAGERLHQFDFYKKLKTSLRNIIVFLDVASTLIIVLTIVVSILNACRIISSTSNAIATGVLLAIAVSLKTLALIKYATIAERCGILGAKLEPLKKALESYQSEYTKLKGKNSSELESLRFGPIAENIKSFDKLVKSANFFKAGVIANFFAFMGSICDGCVMWCLSDSGLDEDISPANSLYSGYIKNFLGVIFSGKTHYVNDSQGYHEGRPEGKFVIYIARDEQELRDAAENMGILHQSLTDQKRVSMVLTGPPGPSCRYFYRWDSGDGFYFDIAAWTEKTLLAMKLNDGEIQKELDKFEQAVEEWIIISNVICAGSHLLEIQTWSDFKKLSNNGSEFQGAGARSA